MVREIIEIDAERCDGCGLCAAACHEGAIGMVDGKARLLRDDYCDGLGDCLPACPTDAIHFVEREAAAYDAAAVAASQAAAADNAKRQAPESSHEPHHHGGGCPGARAMAFARKSQPGAASHAASGPKPGSALAQWPVQIRLAPVRAPYFDGTRLLVAADCAAYAYAAFHEDFMAGHVTLIGCPKLDEVDYAEKLAAILQSNDVKSVDVVRMEVPCCGGIQNAVVKALGDCGKMIPWQVHTLTTDGRLLDE